MCTTRAETIARRMLGVYIPMKDYFPKGSVVYVFCIRHLTDELTQVFVCSYNMSHKMLHDHTHLVCEHCGIRRDATTGTALVRHEVDEMPAKVVAETISKKLYEKANALTFQQLTV